MTTTNLPHGQEWAWFADANVVALSPALDDYGRARALIEVSDFWRRKCLQVIGGTGIAAMLTSVAVALNESGTNFTAMV